jgi:hypothetical protein
LKFIKEKMLAKSAMDGSELTMAAMAFPGNFGRRFPQDQISP